MIHQIFVHFEISRLPGSLGHSADSNTISWNLTTTFHSIQIALIRLMSLLSTRRTARSAISIVSERQGVVVRWFHENSSHDFPNSNKSSVWITFGFCDGSEHFRKIILRLLWSFGFTQVVSTEWWDLVPRQRTVDYCSEIHFCALLLSSHQSLLFVE